MAKDLVFENEQKEAVAPRPYKGYYHFVPLKDRETVTVIIHASQDGMEGEKDLVNIRDPNSSASDGKWLHLPRNKAVEIDKRCLNRLGDKGPYKIVVEKEPTGNFDPLTGKPIFRNVERRLYRFPVSVQ